MLVNEKNVSQSNLTQTNNETVGVLSQEKCSFHAPTVFTKDMYRGYFPLWRKIVNWGWYKDSNTKAVFLHLLLTANHKETDFLGHKIKEGECVHGLLELSSNLGLSVQSIRTAIKHLKSTSEITTRTTNRFTIYILTNYFKYTPKIAQLTSELTNHQQTTNKQLTTSKNDKNDKNNNIYNVHFETIWSKYPKPIGKKQAYRHYRASVTDEESAKNIEIALENYLNSKTVKDGFIQNGSTWFNNWQDWVVVKTSPSPQDEWKKLGLI